MLKLSQKEKKELKKVAQKYNLRFIIAHGSYATGKERPGSDLDVAVLGTHKIPFDKLLEIHGELSDIFGDNRERELDLKQLNGTDPLFKYYVARDGILLHGDGAEYEEYRAYTRRSFEFLQDILDLEKTLLRKQNALILNRHA